jgi:hypothetical protein
VPTVEIEKFKNNPYENLIKQIKMLNWLDNKLHGNWGASIPSLRLLAA